MPMALLGIISVILVWDILRRASDEWGLERNGYRYRGLAFLGNTGTTSSISSNFSLQNFLSSAISSWVSFSLGSLISQLRKVSLTISCYAKFDLCVESSLVDLSSGFADIKIGFFVYISSIVDVTPQWKSFGELFYLSC